MCCSTFKHSRSTIVPVKANIMARVRLNMWRGLEKGGLHVKKSFFTFLGALSDGENEKVLTWFSKSEKKYQNFGAVEKFLSSEVE